MPFGKEVKNFTFLSKMVFNISTLFFFKLTMGFTIEPINLNFLFTIDPMSGS